LKLLEPIGVFSNNTKKTLYFSDQAKKEIEDLFFKRNIEQNDFLVAISPSAGNKIKNWPAKRFAEVADYLIEKYKAKIFIIGTKMDKEEVEEMLNNMSHRSEVVNTLGTMSIDALKALISRMKAFISVDTGPIYIAEAFGVPTIDIIGPMDENEQPPRGARHINVIDPQRGDPIIHIMNSRIYDKEKARKSIENISVKMVTDAFDNLYKII
jgi:ADP-heptose:LPS heptosyltransferase